MAEKNQQSKRTRSELSSASELDSSVNTPPKKKNSKKKENNEETNLSSIQKELKQINLKLSNVMTKDDGKLKEMIKEIIQQMKNELTKSVEKKIEVLESAIFDKNEENDKLKTEVKKLNETIQMQNTENDALRQEVEKNKMQMCKAINDHEQYSRSNNIRINGLTETITKNKEGKDIGEDAYATRKKVVKELHKYLPGLEITDHDVDVAHRLGKLGKDKKGSRK